MKKILVIDESNLFRDFLQTKLQGFDFEVVTAVNGLDGSTKMRREVPDLIIMDYYLSRLSSIELLQAKKADPNTASVPVILTSGKLEKEKILQVAPYNVMKVFTKPIRMDALVQSISQILGVAIEIDNTPSIIEAHFNDEILFVEIAQGLNKEKIELLRYKIKELLDLYDVETPKVLVIMSSIEVNADDSLKLNALFATLLDATGARAKSIKVLTTSTYMREFMADREEFAGIEVTDNLESAMDGLLGRRAGSYMDRQSKTVQQEFLQSAAPKKEKGEAIETRFETERLASSDLASAGSAIRIAIVDDDYVIREMVKAVLADTGFTIQEFQNGSEFTRGLGDETFDLVFLDLMMPEMDGFQVMAWLQEKEYEMPIIVLSALSQRETVIKALQFGVTSYLTKPLQPQAVLNKAREVLKTNF
ncbi:MAG: response regulator [Spirochaetales bacterium]